MNKYRNILVVADSDLKSNMSLSRAVHIAQQEGADQIKIKFFLVIYDFSYELTSVLPQSEREEMRNTVIHEKLGALTKIAESYSHCATIEVKAIWNSHYFDAILEEVTHFDHDLVIKNSYLHPPLQSFIFTPTDWHLIRKSPVPVLLVKDEHWQKGGDILAAINCSEDDDIQDVLNHKIIQEGLEVSKLLQGTLHIINSYVGTPINIAIELPDFDPQAYDAALKKHHWEKLTNYADQYQIPHAQIHLVEGTPEETLPEICLKMQTHTLILGSLGRTGFSAALVGNTAEHIIDQVSCDLLVIKRTETPDR